MIGNLFKTQIQFQVSREVFGFRCAVMSIGIVFLDSKLTKGRLGLGSWIPIWLFVVRDEFLNLDLTSG